MSVNFNRNQNKNRSFEYLFNHSDVSNTPFCFTIISIGLISFSTFTFFSQFVFSFCLKLDYNFLPLNIIENVSFSFEIISIVTYENFALEKSRLFNCHPRKFIKLFNTKSSFLILLKKNLHPKATKKKIFSVDFFFFCRFVCYNRFGCMLFSCCCCYFQLCRPCLFSSKDFFY